MQSSKLRQVVSSGGTWQLTFAILSLIAGALSISSNAITALVSVALGIFALLSALAARKYEDMGSSTHLADSLKYEKIYFIIAVVYYVLILLAVAFFAILYRDAVNLWWASFIEAVNR